MIIRKLLYRYIFKSNLGLSSSSWKPMQSQWCARLADLRFQYSRNVTAEKYIDFELLLLKMQFFWWRLLKCFCQNHISGMNLIYLPNTLNETYPKTTWTQHRKQFLDGQRGMQSECSSKSKYSFQYFENWKPCVTWYKGQVLQFVHWGHMVMLKLEYIRWLC